MMYLVHPYLENPRMLVGWVNGNLYQRTKEVSGVLPIPDALRIKAGMGVYIHAHHHKQVHQFLASRQGTRKPILPINNDSERRLFRELMASESGGNLATGPNWDNITILWNSKAEGAKEISYKVSTTWISTSTPLILLLHLLATRTIEGLLPRRLEEADEHQANEISHVPHTRRG